MSLPSLSALAPCPFCGGGEAEICHAVFAPEAAAEEGWEQAEFWLVSCPCGAVHGDYPGHVSEGFAVAAWNKRQGSVVN